MCMFFRVSFGIIQTEKDEKQLNHRICTNSHLQLIFNEQIMQENLFFAEYILKKHTCEMLTRDAS